MSADDVEQSLVSRFAIQVERHSDCVAVCDRSLSLTYRELDEWSSGIAGTVLAAGPVGREPVALVLDQSTASVAGIVGVLKTGSPYVSLDPDDPRASELVDRVGARVVLTDRHSRAAARKAAGRRPLVVVDEVAPRPCPRVDTCPDDIAYVFFTSGTTGRPKGVFDSHRNVLHNVLRYTNTLQIRPHDRLSLIQSPSFSGTVSTLFSSLLNGASVFPISLRTEGLAELARRLLDERVTIYHSVPAIFRSLVTLEAGPYDDVRIVRLEGDRASWHDVELHRRHFARGSVLVNGLGLTETGLARQLFVDHETSIGRGVLPVGYPVPDVDVVVLDEGGREATPGAAGEIAVVGVYLAIGYWDDPELTNASFTAVNGKRAYRTGDLGRFREDGCLEYLGRQDGRLKILGNRVEPAEVEAELTRIPGIADAVVTTREGRRGEGQLVALVTATGADLPTAKTIRDRLGARLPPFMVPSVVEIVSELPLAPSGKLDRRSLRDAPSRSSGPAGAVERLVAETWEEILEIEGISPDADFFALGGDSLAAAEIVARLERQTGIALPMSVFAGSPTVSQLVDVIRVSKAGLPAPLVTLGEDGDAVPLVLVHGNTGNALHYAELVRIAKLGRPLWALEHPEPAESIGEISRRHVDTLLEANPDGPHLILGFCFGAIVAQEMACQLVEKGHTVGFLALLGITPHDFPGVVSPAARDAWRRQHGHMPSLVSRIRWHAERAVELPLDEKPKYVATKLASIAARMARRVVRRPAAHELLWQALLSHQPRRFPGRALVVLHRDETAEYTLEPAREWASLAREIELVELAGREHAMLENPGVRLLEKVLAVALEHAAVESGEPASTQR